MNLPLAGRNRLAAGAVESNDGDQSKERVAAAEQPSLIVPMEGVLLQPIKRSDGVEGSGSEEQTGFVLQPGKNAEIRQFVTYSVT